MQLSRREAFRSTIQSALSTRAFVSLAIGVLSSMWLIQAAFCNTKKNMERHIQMLDWCWLALICSVKQAGLHDRYVAAIQLKAWYKIVVNAVGFALLLHLFVIFFLLDHCLQPLIT